MALRRAIWLFVVSASEIQMSRRTQRPFIQLSTSAAAPPGFCRPSNWFPRQDSSAWILTKGSAADRDSVGTVWLKRMTRFVGSEGAQ